MCITINCCQSSCHATHDLIMGAHSPLLVRKHEIVQVTLIYQESGSMNDGGQEPVLD